MARLGRRVVTLTSALALAVAPLGIPASSATTQAPVSAYPAAHLEAGTADLLPVFVHADDVATAKRAVSASGLVLVSTWDRIGVAVARGTAAQVENVRTRPGVTYVEGDQPIEFTLATSTVATRGEEARATLVDGAGRPLDGKGISVAVVDSGIDGKHPFFRVPGAHSAVRANLKGVCVITTARDRINDRCFVDVTNLGSDTDMLSAGGHGTHVAGIVAGRDVTLTNGRQLQGSAPGAMLIGLSVGQALSIYGADIALNWVLEHHADPCGSRLNLTLCPPIKVTNNSYGPVGGGQFNENSATVKLQRALAAEGVLTVWAAGNDGGDGSEPHQPAGSGSDRRRHLGRLVLRPEHRNPRRRRVRLLLARAERRAVDVPRPVRARGGDRVPLPAVPGHLLQRPDAGERAGAQRHRDVQHDLRYVDGRAAHRRHRGHPAAGRPDGDARCGRGRSRADGVPVRRRRGVRARHSTRR